jgi:ribonuclease Z
MSTLSLTFLGTSAAVPTAARNLSGLFLKRGGDAFLFDCGEGTQRQMVRFGTGFSLSAIFFTHFHADHYLGIIGMLRTFAMQAVPRADAAPLRLYGPRPAASLLPRMINLGIEELAYPIEIVEVEPGAAFHGEGYRIEAFATKHRIASVGYALIEAERPGRFDLDRARALGVPAGPLFGRLQRGEPITLPDGRAVRPEDVLVHESTFGDDEAERAVHTAHSTAREAARVARDAGAKRLVLTHLSSRYDMDPDTLLRQAKSEMAACEVANDGRMIEVPLRD